MSNCSTASATARRKSPSPAFSSNSASTNLSSVIGSSRVLQVEVFQLHLSRLGPMATSTTPQPYTADRPENSTTSVDANGSRGRGRADDCHAFREHFGCQLAVHSYWSFRP